MIFLDSGNPPLWQPVTRSVPAPKNLEGLQTRMPRELENRPAYDLPTAVTFLLAGLTLGAVLTVLLSPLKNAREVFRSNSEPRSDFSG